MARRLRVQHWVACLQARSVAQPSWVHPYDLLGVSYTHFVPSALQFPLEVPRLDLFARFVHGRGSREFEVQVLWVDGPGGVVDVQTYGPFTVFFRPGESVRGYVFRLLNVPLPGPGRYRFLLWAVRRRHELLATEFLEVLSQP